MIKKRGPKLVMLFTILIYTSVFFTTQSFPSHADTFTPSWWNPNNSTSCNSSIYSDAQAAPNQTSYRGIVSCIPTPNSTDHWACFYTDAPYSSNAPICPSGDGVAQDTFWCTEMVARYMKAVFNITPFGFNGYSLLSSYASTHDHTFTPVNNNTSGSSPQVGDILSLGNPNGSGYSHTAIVIGNSVNGSGNGTIEVLQQNAVANGVDYPNQSLNVGSNAGLPAWEVNGEGANSFSQKTGLYVNGWLHVASPPPPTPNLVVTSGIYTSGNTYIGGLENANFTVTNIGNAPITIQQLYIEGRGPNGQNVDLGGDGTGKTIQANGGTDYIYKSTNSFGSGCNNCSTGTYTLTAQYVDNNSNFQTPGADGGSVSTQINVVSPANIKVTSGISVSNPTVGSSYSSSFTVTNVGGQSFTPNQLVVDITGPDGYSSYWGNGNNSPIAPNGGTETLSYLTSNFCNAACPSGTYTATAMYQDSGGYESLGAQGGGQSSALFDVYRPSINTSTTKVSALYDISTQRVNLFTLGTDTNVYTDYSRSGGSDTWSGWNAISPGNAPIFAGNPTSIYYTQNGYSIDQVFARDVNDNGWVSTNDNWTGWSPWVEIPGGSIVAGDIVPVLDGNDWVELYARGTGNQLINDIQNFQAQSGWSSWSSSLGGGIQGNPAVVEHTNGTIEVFARGGNGLWHIWQTQISGAWSGWDNIPGTLINDPTVSINNVGQPAVFFPSTGGYVYYASQIAGGPSGGPDSQDWSGLTSLSGQSDVTQPVIRHTDGSLEVFVLSTDQNIWHTWQNSGGGFGSWDGLGGTAAIMDPAVILNSLNLPEFFTRGSANIIYHRYQLSGGPGGAPNTDWSGWINDIGATP
jgi:hypothetical protein